MCRWFAPSFIFPVFAKFTFALFYNYLSYWTTYFFHLSRKFPFFPSFFLFQTDVIDGEHSHITMFYILYTWCNAFAIVRHKKLMFAYSTLNVYQLLCSIKYNNSISGSLVNANGHIIKFAQNGREKKRGTKQIVIHTATVMKEKSGKIYSWCLTFVEIVFSNSFSLCM